MQRPDPEYLDTLTERTQEYIAWLEAEIERLRTALLQYGGHTATCIFEPIIGRQPDCDCGWLDIEAVEAAGGE